MKIIILIKALVMVFFLFLFVNYAFSQDVEVEKDVLYKSISGVDPNLLSLDVYYNPSGRKLPVLVMIHGGGWSIGDKANKNVHTPKAKYFVEHGFVFVSVNYRLSPAVMHPAHVRDVAASLRWVKENIRKYGGDKKKIFVMGHSAGAHLAALVSVDPKYLKAEKSTLNLIKGTILLDGAGYNLPERMPTLNPESLLGKMYFLAFGYDEDVWKDASPTLQIKKKRKIAPFLIFYTGNKNRGEINYELADTLEQKGYSAVVHWADDKDHEEMNKHIGCPRDWATLELMAFLADVLAGK